MNRLICSILFLIFSSISFSQKVFFIYIQSETEQPFFVKLNDKNLSSSQSGYVILSQLKDSIYNFKIGFQQAKWPEQDFSIAIKGGDHGFLLKNFNEKGWGLFDLQTLAIHMANKRETGKVKTDPEVVSLFTEILAKAANDPSLREKPVFAVAKEEKPVVGQTIAKQEAVVIQNDSQVTVRDKNVDTIKLIAIEKSDKAAAGDTVATQASPKKEVSKVSPGDITQKPSIREKQPEVDTTNKLIAVSKNDQIPPNDSASLLQQSKKVDEKSAQNSRQQPPGSAEPQPVKLDSARLTASSKNEQTSEASIAKRNETIGSKAKSAQPQANYRRSVVSKKSESSGIEGLGLVFIDQYPNGVRDTIAILIPNPISAYRAENKPQGDEKKFLNIGSSEEAEPSPVKTKKSKCPVTATQNDFLKLRKKMAAQKNDEAMLREAVKEFKSRCFTNDQLKNLGVLFLTEPGKFQFFEAAYPHSSDPASFEGLQAEFKDPYFIHRFKNLVK